MKAFLAATSVLAVVSTVACSGAGGDNAGSAPSFQSEANGSDPVAAPRASIDELVAQAESSFAAGAPLGRSSLAWQLDASEPVLVRLEIGDVTLPGRLGTTSIPLVSIKTQGETSFALTMQVETPALGVGTYPCAQHDGKLVIALPDGTSMSSTSSTSSAGTAEQAAAPSCTLTITKRSVEEVPVQLRTMIRPRTILVGHVEATVATEAGESHAIRAGVVVAEPKL